MRLVSNVQETRPGVRAFAGAERARRGGVPELMAARADGRLRLVLVFQIVIVVVEVVAQQEVQVQLRPARGERLQVDRLSARQRAVDVQILDQLQVIVLVLLDQLAARLSHTLDVDPRERERERERERGSS